MSERRTERESKKMRENHGESSYLGKSSVTDGYHISILTQDDCLLQGVGLCTISNLLCTNEHK